MYVLIIVTSVYGGLHITTQEFENQAHCRNAIPLVLSIADEQRKGYTSATCIPK